MKVSDFEPKKKKFNIEEMFYKDLERISDLSKLKQNIVKYSNLNPNVDELKKIDVKTKMQKKK